MCLRLNYQTAISVGNPCKRPVNYYPVYFFNVLLLPQMINYIKRSPCRDGGIWTPPSNSGTTKRHAISGIRKSVENNATKTLWSIFGSCQKVRSPEVIKGQILPISTFLNKPVRMDSRTRKATAPRQSAFDSSFNAPSADSQIWPEIDGLASREQKLLK